MSASDWYGHGRENGVVGEFPPGDEPTKVYGGPLDGDVVVWPRERSPIVYETVLKPSFCDFYRPPPAEDPIPIVRTYYGLHRLVHAPEEDAEGPIAIEWVWTTNDWSNPC